jgi:hypothetical protein
VLFGVFGCAFVECGHMGKGPHFVALITKGGKPNACDDIEARTTAD